MDGLCLQSEVVALVAMEPEHTHTMKRRDLRECQELLLAH